MKVTNEMLEEYVAYRSIAFAIGDLFQLSEKQLLHKNAPDWIVDVVKQYQTAFMGMKAVKMHSSESQSVETYHSDEPLPPKPTKILTDALKGE